MTTSDQDRDAIARIRALADLWDIPGDARYAGNRIAKQTAAREIRRAIDGDDDLRRETEETPDA